MPIAEIRLFIAEREREWLDPEVEKPKPKKPNFANTDGVLMHDVQGALVWTVAELKKLLGSSQRLTEKQRERASYLFGIAQMAHWMCVPRPRPSASLNRTEPLGIVNGKTIIPA